MLFVIAVWLLEELLGEDCFAAAAEEQPNSERQRIIKNETLKQCFVFRKLNAFIIFILRSKDSLLFSIFEYISTDRWI
jgi:hypothetical protein